MSATTPFKELSDAALATELQQLEQDYRKACNTNLKLNLTRGKPADAQLDLANKLDGILGGNYLSANGTDARNYGGIRGLPEARELGGELLGVKPESVIAGGNSSLELMHSVASFVVRRLWNQFPARALCPVPVTTVTSPCAKT